MSGYRYRTQKQFRAEVGTGTTEFNHEWIDQEHMRIGTDGRLYQYHPPTHEEDVNGYR